MKNLAIRKVANFLTPGQLGLPIKPGYKVEGNTSITSKELFTGNQKVTGDRCLLSSGWTVDLLGGVVSKIVSGRVYGYRTEIGSMYTRDLMYVLRPYDLQSDLKDPNNWRWITIKVVKQHLIDW